MVFRRLAAILLLTGCVLALALPVSAASYVVVANRDVPDESLSGADLRAIFLGEKVKWNHKKYIKIAVMENGQIYKDFLQTVVGKTPSQFDNHWLKLVYTGKAAMPPSFAEMDKLLEYVATHPGAIGFVESGHAGNSVKVLAIK